MHAWPELYFDGAGWVRFEPTPAGRADDVPAYTVPGSARTTSPSEPRRPTRRARRRRRPERPADATAEDAGRRRRRPATAATGIPWLPALGGVVGVAVVVAGGLLLPRAAPRRGAASGGSPPATPEPVWAELRDTAVDLGVPWPRDRSPRATRDVLVDHLGAPGRLDHRRAARRTAPSIAPEARRRARPDRRTRSSWTALLPLRRRPLTAVRAARRRRDLRGRPGRRCAALRPPAGDLVAALGASPRPRTARVAPATRRGAVRRRRRPRELSRLRRYVGTTGARTSSRVRRPSAIGASEAAVFAAAAPALFHPVHEGAVGGTSGSAWSGGRPPSMTVKPPWLGWPARGSGGGGAVLTAHRGERDGGRGRA